jgi:hypothetical protein
MLSPVSTDIKNSYTLSMIRRILLETGRLSIYQGCSDVAGTHDGWFTLPDGMLLLEDKLTRNCAELV